MHEVKVTTHFSAAHRLVGHDGACANPHGHNWEVEVTVRGSALDEIGVLVDFHVVTGAVDKALAELDHSDLNTLAAFAAGNPTSENIARHLFRSLARELNCDAYRLHRVTVSETPGKSVSYWE